MSFGATVILEDADSAGVLKCSLESIRGKSLSALPELEPFNRTNSCSVPDANGLILNKAVRFRVEIYPYSRTDGNSIIADDAGQAPQAIVHCTSMTFTQEKGALSCFKAVHTRLRHEWR